MIPEMITELRLQNFKCFGDARIPLASLTLLAGINASGKSTTLQALLLLRQSHLQGTLARGELRLQGALVNIGTAHDALNELAISDEISFELTTASQTTRFAFAYEVDPARSYWLRAEAGVEYNQQINLFTPQFNYLNAERIGPLLYPMDEQRRNTSDLGTRGEYTEQVLAWYRDAPIGCERLAYQDEKAGATSLTLAAQTRYWMRTIVPGFDFDLEELTAADQVRIGFSTGTERYVRPTNIGFGIIYTLPIVVGALVAKPGSLLLIENPEAHLHPAGQSQIGRFLARAAAAGVQVIIETHSDHILNGIRRAVHDGTIPAEQVAIVFFTGGGRVTTPRIYPDGGIDVWPEGFFDQIEKDLQELF